VAKLGLYNNPEQSQTVGRRTEMFGVVHPRVDESLLSVGEFFLRKMLSDAIGALQTVVRIRGRPQVLDDLCGHWLFGQALVGRTGEEALFRLDERVVLGICSSRCWFTAGRSVLSPRNRRGDAGRRLTGRRECICP